MCQGQCLPAVCCVGGAGGTWGAWLAVTPGETQALFLAGAAGQGGGTGVDWGEMSCSVQIFPTGNLLLHPREVIWVYKFVWFSVPWKCKLICSFPRGCLACFFLSNELLGGKKKTKQWKM